MTLVIKQGGRKHELFDPDKLHRSIVATCRSVRTPDGQADEIAARVTLVVMGWCQSRPQITSADIRRQASNALAHLHADAAYVYKHDKMMM
ncbi:MAG: ATP cone domain-containing protein [Candidatus Saccharibacteria bacterium]|nr:ATP cone domain-containing protein [Candidatus Saccharibacteria bacterium]